MVLTPWGRGDELRRRMLTSRPRTTPEEAARNQRERLFGAMVASCAERGYEATTVGELIALAGVSRRDFYKHFEDKRGCFLATLREAIAAARRVVDERLAAEQSRKAQVKATLEALVDLVIAQPAAARLCLVEAHAAGAVATAEVDAAVSDFEEMVARALAERPGQKPMPEALPEAMVGGLRKLVHARLHRGAESELRDLAPALLELALRYEAPPRPLRRRRGREGAMPPRSDRARGRLAEDPAERIIRATTVGVAAHGFPALTIGEIAESAGVSLSTFYEHFDGKTEALDAALYSGRTRLIGVAMPAYRRARSWPEAVRAVTRSSYEFLAGEPEFACLVTAGVLGAGRETIERHERALESAQSPFREGRELLGVGLQPEAIEALTLSCFALTGEWIRDHGAENLRDAAPLATYLALFPFLGAAEACRVANGGSWRPTAPSPETRSRQPARPPRRRAAPRRRPG